MSIHSLSTALSGFSGTEPPLAGIEAKIFREFLVVLAAGELRPGALVSETAVAGIYGIAADRIRHVFRALEHIGLMSSPHALGAQIEAIAPEDAPEIVERTRTLTRHAVERLTASGLDRPGRDALLRHIRQQTAAEASGDWPHNNILCMEFLALLSRVGGGGPRTLDRQAMRLMLLRASYDRYGEPAPSASTQSLLLDLITRRRADEAARVIDALFEGIERRLWLEGECEEADLRGLLARVTRPVPAPRPPHAGLRLIAVDGRRLDDD